MQVGKNSSSTNNSNKTQQNKTKIEWKRNKKRRKKWQEKRSDYLVIYCTYIIVRLGKPVCAAGCCVYVIFRCNCTLWLPLLKNRESKAEKEKNGEKIIHFQMYTFMFGFECIRFFCSFLISFLVSVPSALWFSCPFLLCTRVPTLLDLFSIFSRTFFISSPAWFTFAQSQSQSHSHLLSPKVRSFKITPTAHTQTIISDFLLSNGNPIWKINGHLETKASGKIKQMNFCSCSLSTSLVGCTHSHRNDTGKNKAETMCINCRRTSWLMCFKDIQKPHTLTHSEIVFTQATFSSLCTFVSVPTFSSVLITYCGCKCGILDFNYCAYTLSLHNYRCCHALRRCRWHCHFFFCHRQCAQTNKLFKS